MKQLIEMLREWEGRHSNAGPISNQRRQVGRRTVRWKLQVATVNKETQIPLEFAPGACMNIAPAGLGFITQLPFSAGDWCLCMLYPPTLNLPFVVLGRAIWQLQINRQAIWQDPTRHVFATGMEFLAWHEERECNRALQLAQKEYEGRKQALNSRASANL